MIDQVRDLQYVFVFIASTFLITTSSQDCLNNFPSLSAVTNSGCRDEGQCPFQGENSRETLQIYPSLIITCNGNMNNVTVSGQLSTGPMLRGVFPHLQIWRRQPGTSRTYNRVSDHTFPEIRTANNQQFYTFNMNAQVLIGDIIGLLLPRSNNNQARFNIYTANSSFMSYRLSSTDDTTFTVPSNPPGAITDSRQPYIRLGISPNEITGGPIDLPEDITTGMFITAGSPTTVANPESPVVMTSGLTETPNKPTVFAPTTPPVATPTTVLTGNGNSGAQGGTGAPAGVAIGVIIALLLVLLVIVLIAVGWRKKKLIGNISISSRHNPYHEMKNTQNLSEPLFQSRAANPSAGVYSLATADYHEASYYDYVELNETHLNKDLNDYSTPEEISISGYDSQATKRKRLSPRWGLVVPSTEQRAKISSEDIQCDSIQPCAIGESQYSLAGPDPSYFEECEIYWEPSSKVSELYEQLSKKNYREILREQVQIKRFLGSGAYGTVNEGLWQSPGDTVKVAIKTNQKTDENEKAKFLKEAAIMGQFKHPNVVRLYGVVTVGEPVLIILELLSNGDLRNFLLQMQPEPGRTTPLDTPKVLLRFCQQISSGMDYLSRKCFIHRDLAARNILVSEERVCKIGDFGMSRDLMDESYYMSQGGKIPVKWTAPEAIHYRKYSTASDVWSFGCVMYEIWSLGHKPFEGCSNTEAVGKIDNGVRLAPPPGCPKEVYRLIIKCWNPEAKYRPGFSQLVEMFSQADFELLLWSVEDKNVGPQVAVVGAPLEEAKQLYNDLQCTYLHIGEDSQ